MAEAIVYGFQCKCYYNNEAGLGLSGTGTVASPVWVELDILTDATLDLSMSEADASNRAAGGFELKEPVLLSAALNGSLKWINGNAKCGMLLAQFLARGVLDLLILTGSNLNDDAKGVRGDFKIFKFPQKQELKEMVSNEVSFMPCRSLRSNYIAAASGEAE